MISAIAIVLILLIPGRVQGFLYREFFQGRKLLDQRRAVEAIGFFQRFLLVVRSRPWIKRAMWLSWAIYTPDIEAMTLNNIGAANLELGRLDESERALKEALIVDKKYAIPHFNMAVVHEMRGNRMLAENALAEAKRLGYSGGTIDVILNRAQSLLAGVEGRGI
jgi:tetratricopeptide (TPR) repeat protein